MVHKKYIKKNGKVFGPYLYETKRVNGRVVTRYVGVAKEEKKKKSKLTYFFLYGIVIVFLALAFFLISNYVESNYQETENLESGISDTLEPESEVLLAPIPGCQVLNIMDEVYTLTGSDTSTGNCFDILETGIVLDGQGNSITLTSGSGFGVNDLGRNGITVQNIDIIDYDISIAGFHDVTCQPSDVNLFNSNVEIIDVHGPLQSGPCGDVAGLEERGGDVVIVESEFDEILNYATGGGATDVRNINITAVNIDMDSDSIDTSCTGTCSGLPGKITINFTNSFSDVGANYGFHNRLHFINNSAGEIDWEDNVLNLGAFSFSSDLEISDNYAFIDDKFPAFLDAEITLYNVPDFTDPRIFRNGVPCGSICNQISGNLDNGDVVFTVDDSGFYYIDENNLLSIGVTSPPGDIDVGQGQSYSAVFEVGCGNIGGCGTVDVSLQYPVSGGIITNPSFDNAPDFDGWTQVINQPPFGEQGYIATTLNSDANSAPNSYDAFEYSTGNCCFTQGSMLAQTFVSTSADFLQYYLKSNFNPITASHHNLTISLQSNNQWVEVVLYNEGNEPVENVWQEYNIDITSIPGLDNSAITGINITAYSMESPGTTPTSEILLDDFCLADSGMNCIAPLNLTPTSSGGGEPFYITNTVNPTQITLNNGESQTVSFVVEADPAATLGTMREFFGEADAPSVPINSESVHWTATVVLPDVSAPAPVIDSIGGDTAAAYSINDDTPAVLVSTNEDADCYAIVGSDLDYSAMSIDPNAVDCTVGTNTVHACFFTDPLSPDGDYDFYVACRDLIGNENTNLDNAQAIGVEIDTAVPVNMSFSPDLVMSPFVTSDPFDLDFTTDEDADCYAIIGSDLSYTDMSVDPGAVDCTIGTSTSHSCSLTGFSEGMMETIYIACADDTEVNPNEYSIEGNTEFDVTVDTIAPDVTIIFPVDGENYDEFTPLIYDVQLNEPGTVNYTLNAGPTTMMFDQGGNLFSAFEAGLSPGVYTFQVFASDAAGNINSAESVTFTIGSTNVNECVELDENHSVYNQVSNIVPPGPGPCIRITGENVTFNGNGYWISNDLVSSSGIMVFNHNATINGTNITMSSSGGGVGVTLVNANAQDAFILNNTFEENNIGLQIFGAERVRVFNNTIFSNEQGIFASGIGNGNLSSNNVSANNLRGISLVQNSVNNTIERNIVENGLGEGIYLDDSSNNSIVNNFVEGNTLGGISLLDSSDLGILIENTLVQNGDGIILENSDNLLMHNSINGGEFGVSIGATSGSGFISANNTLINTTIDSATKGLFMKRTYWNEIDNLTILNSQEDALTLFDRSNENNFSNVSFSGTNPAFYDFNSTGVVDLFAEYNIPSGNNYWIDSSAGRYWIRSVSMSFVNSSVNGGEILFNQTIGGEGTSLDDDIMISNNFAFVDSVQPGFNRTARIVLRNVGPFSSPGILQDGAECGAPNCVENTALQPGVLFDADFNVISWTSYSIGQLPSPPVVLDIEDLGTQFILPGGTQVVTFTTTVTDPDGLADIASVDAAFIFPSGGPATITRSDTDGCSFVSDNGVDAIYQCQVGIEYYDDPGLWDVTVTAVDMGALQDSLTEQFILGATAAFDYTPLPPNGLSWSGASPGATNLLPDGNEPVQLSNIGNENYNSIEIEGFDLIGQTNPGFNIPSEQFSANVLLACEGDVFNAEGQPAISVSGASLPFGMGSQEDIYICLEDVPIGLPAQDYASSLWDVTPLP